ncbi:HAD family hydrolase [Nocardia sp. NPDC058058]|uniref:HAD family hydrolase n=1 Tax=Nocardia sp. NPDC058058 TaxID=3346317 RepID=UPI0036DD2BB3
MVSVDARVGLPETISAVLFDLDGVLTSTAAVHERAWKQVFDEFLVQWCGPGTPLFSGADYRDHVDGLPRLDGVRAFLKSRDITVPEGESGAHTDEWTVHGIGDRKDRVLRGLIDREGVHVYPGSADYLTAVRAAGLRIGVVSSSANAAAVLTAADLAGFVEIRIDGKTFAERGLAGKPAPDGFLAGAAGLGVRPDECAVFEDAIAGVAAGHAGKFGFVVGVQRTGASDHAQALRDAGADVVVADLAELGDR